MNKLSPKDTYSNVGQGASSVLSFSLTSTLGDLKPFAALFLLSPQTTDPGLLLHLPCSILLVADNSFCSRKALLLSSTNTFKKGSICKKKMLNTKQDITDS